MAGGHSSQNILITTKRMRTIGEYNSVNNDNSASQKSRNTLYRNVFHFHYSVADIFNFKINIYIFFSSCEWDGSETQTQREGVQNEIVILGKKSK